MNKQLISTKNNTRWISMISQFMYIMVTVLRSQSTYRKLSDYGLYNNSMITIYYDISMLTFNQLSIAYIIYSIVVFKTLIYLSVTHYLMSIVEHILKDLFLWNFSLSCDTTLINHNSSLYGETTWFLVVRGRMRRRSQNMFYCNIFFLLSVIRPIILIFVNKNV